MNNLNEFNEAISFMKDANRTLKNVRFFGPEASACNCCCSSHGGGKAKYEEKESVNNKSQTR